MPVMETPRSLSKICWTRPFSQGSGLHDDRVLRGGNWNNNPSNCRTVNRNYNYPSNRNNNYGFRVVVAVSR